MTDKRERRPSGPVPDRDPEEEGSAAKRQQRPNPPSQDPEEEGSAARPER
jgi:hypothetical protein